MTTQLDLGAIKPLLEIVAAERTHSRPELFEDAVQEGLIAAWCANVKHPGKDAVYYRVAAKNGLRGLLQGRSPFGQPSRQGKRDAHSGAIAGEMVTDTPDTASAEALEAAESGEQVRKALRSIEDLEAREDVFMRFWRDMTWAEIAEVRGVPKNRLEWRWREHTRPMLKEALADVA